MSRELPWLLAGAVVLAAMVLLRRPAGMILRLLGRSALGMGVLAILEAAKEAAARGAKESEQYVSKFGRAKSYGTKTIGTPDAGAVSMSWFFQGLARE